MKPIDPRLLRHARHSRIGIALLAALGTAQALASLAVAFALTLLIAGDRGTVHSKISDTATGSSAGGGSATGGSATASATTGGSAGGGSAGGGSATGGLGPPDSSAWHLGPWHVDIGAGHGWALALLAGAFLLRAGLAWAEQVVAHRAAARVSDELRRSLVRALGRRGPAWVARFGAGRLTTLLTSGLDALRPWFAGYLPALVLGVALPPLVLLAIALVDPASALIALATLPLIPLLGALIGWATQARAQQRWAADARLAGYFLDVVRGLGTLRTFGRAERQTEVVAALTDRHRSATLRVLRVAFLSSTALDLVGTLSVGLIAVEAGLRVAAGHLALGPALLIILLAPEAYRPLREMAARYHAATDATAVIADVDEVLHDLPPAPPTTIPTALPSAAPTAPRPALPTALPTALPSALPTAHPSALPTAHPSALPTTLPTELPTAHPTAHPTALPTAHPTALPAALPTALPSALPAALPTELPTALPAATANPGLAAAGLRVRHPGATRDALRLDALVVGAGELVALAGPSGAGKTTALRALAGLQPLDAGTVALDGRTVYVPQNPSLPHARAVADVFPPGTPARTIEAALRSVGLSPDLTAATPLGEHGTGISAGQRHRLALAAALQQTPATLLLDEPTAHLDPETERQVITRLREAAARGSAILVAAHRAALLAAADRTVAVTPPPAASTIAPARQFEPDGGPAEPTPETAAADQPSFHVDQPHPGTWVGPTKAAGYDIFPPQSTAPEGRSAARGRGGVSVEARERTDDAAASRSAADVGSERGWARWRRPWVAVVVGVASSIAGLVLTGAAGWLLVRAASLPPVLTLSAAVVLVRGSAVARPLLRYVERLVAHDVAFARLGARRAGVYAALVPRVPGPRLRRRGDLLSKVVDDVDAQVDGLLRGRLPAWAGWATLAAGAGVAVCLAPAAGWALAAGLVIAGVVAPVVAARRAAALEAATVEARVALRDAMVETVDGVEELRGSGLDRVPERRSRELAAREAQAARSAGGAAALAHAGWGVAVVGTAIAMTRAGLSHEWSAVLLLVVVALGEAALGLPEAAVARLRATEAGNRLAGLVAEPSPATFPADRAGISVASGSARAAGGFGTVSVRGLVAGWGDHAVLEGLDLELPEGARVAVVGRSGAGKSTLGAVLARLLDARAGSITVGGRDVRALAERDVRGRIVLVGDDTGHIFASTVRENLRLAGPAATDDELREALRRVRLDEWLAGLAGGLDTWLGTGGNTMSGGQARRLATARALLAEPDLLILDEPTEGLDEPTARGLMRDLLDAAGGRTVLMLTHRTEGLDRVDQVLTLRGGRLSAESRAGSR